MNFDVIIVGGGLGGSALACQLSNRGLRTLVLERETRFKDRVRGEQMHPWGMAAAQRLGILEDLVAAGAHVVPFWTTYLFGNPVDKRHLPHTTAAGLGSLNMYHPDMQDALLRRALASGADVRRGASVENVAAEPSSGFRRVTFVHEGDRHTATARIVVGADGRNSKVRTWGGFEVKRDPNFLTLAGVLLEGAAAPEDSVHLAIGAEGSMLFVPQGKGRARAYYCHVGGTADRALSGKENVGEFIRLCRTTGAPEDWFATAEAVGPLASFETAEHWVESPSRDGIALIGDAAGATDPAWGCGLSLTLLDVETLTSCLRSVEANSPNEAWTDALRRYGAQHDDYYAKLHRILKWSTELAWTQGPAADARRQRVFPRMFRDPTGFPDVVGHGPFGPSDEGARRLILGEDAPTADAAAGVALG